MLKRNIDAYGIKGGSYSYHIMRRRITIMLDDELAKKLHEKQAKLIREETSSVSFSSVLNDVLREGLKRT